MLNKHSGTPRRFSDLPQDVQRVCTALRDRLKVVLGSNLYGIYLYGAVVFPEMKHIHDIDCHVILKKPLTAREKEEVRQLHKELAGEHPVVGNDLDAWYILLDDTQQPSPPRHQVHTDLFDNSWALHHAHMRTGYCVTLYGPEPKQVFPAPKWPELMAGLEAERIFIEKHLSEYPDYCALNLCRLIYSYRMKDVVISKQAAAEWALDNLATWRPLIEAALRSYAGEIGEDDERLLESETERFCRSACEMIEDTIKD
jgi:hypothetical protein